MNKRDYVSVVASRLREEGMRKVISLGKYRLYVSDDEGKQVHFDVNQEDKSVLYTIEDVTRILDACVSVAEDLLKKGESIQIKGFGTLGVQRRAATRVKAPGTDDWYDIPPTYVPKFQCGQSLRIAAKLYELSLREAKEKEDKAAEHVPDYLEDDVM